MTDLSAAVRPTPPTMLRWTVLIVLSMAMFGNYYVYDSVAPVADMLKSSLGFTDENIGQLQFFYSIAAAMVLLIGGVIIDRFGTAKSTLLFGAICTVAGILTPLTNNFNVMLGSRFLLGVGAEPLIVAVTTALAKWFKGKELSFAFGINLTIARIGQIAADQSPNIASSLYTSWRGPLVLAAFVGGLCVACGLLYAVVEGTAMRRYQLGAATETEKLVFGDLLTFGRSFWLVVALCVTFYSAIFPFRSFAIKYFQEAWNVTRGGAGSYNSVLPFAGMIATPLFGLVADRFGKRALLMAGGSLVLLPVYAMMAYKLTPLWVPIAMMGVAFSLIPAVMWPSVAYISEEKCLGTAYSLMTLVQQLGVAGMNWAIGRTNTVYNAARNNPAGYIPGLHLLSGLGFLGLLFSVLLRRVETGPHGHGLETITTQTAENHHPEKP